MKRHTTGLLSRLWIIAAIITVTVAVSLSALRTLTPIWFNFYHNPKVLIDDLTEHKFNFGVVKASWRGLGPAIEVEDLEFKSSKKPSSFNVAKLEVRFNILSYLIYHRFYPSLIKADGLQLTLNQTDKSVFEIPELIKFSADMNDSDNQIVEWLLNIRGIRLTNAVLNFKDLKASTHHIQIEQAKLVNDKERHQFQLTAERFDHYNDKINMAADFYGAGPSFADLDGAVLIKLKNTDLANWAAYLDNDQFKILNGYGQVGLRFDWKNKAWKSIELSLLMNDFEMESPYFPGLDEPFDVQGDFVLNNKSKGWSLSGDQVRVQIEHPVYPTNNFSVEFTKNENNEIIVQADRVSLGAIKPILKRSKWANENGLKQLLKMEPEGLFQGILVKLKMQEDKVLSYQASGRFANVSFLARNDLPGMTNLEGMAEADEKSGRLVFYANHPKWTAPKLFTHAPAIERASGEINWTIEGDILRLKSDNLLLQNPEWSLHAETTLDFENDHSPIINMTATISDLDAVRAIHYLPDQLLHPDLYQWLIAAPKKGTLSNVVATIQGPLDQFPYINGGGKFTVTSDLSDVTLNYVDDWPEIFDINGTLIFDGEGMEAEVTSAKLYNGEIQPTKVTIPHMVTEKDSKLYVLGKINSDAADGRQYILDSPLRDTLGDALEPLILSGPVAVDINLTITLGDEIEAAIKALVQTNDMLLKAPEWKFTLNHIAGNFTFTEDGIEGQNLKGETFGKPVVLNIINHNPKTKNASSEFILKGDVSITDLNKTYPNTIWSYLNGKTNYEAHLLLSGDHKNNNSETKLTILTDLMGVTANVPQPFGKTAEESRPLSVGFQFLDNDGVEMNFDIPQQVSAVFSGNFKNGMNMNKGRVRFGQNQKLELPAQGFMIEGTIDDLDVSTWQQFYDDWRKRAKTNQVPEQITTNLFIKNTNLWDFTLHDTTVALSKQPQTWIVNLDGKELAGSVQIPVQTEAPWKLDLSRCNLNKSDTETSQNVEPTDLIAFDFTCQNFNYGERALGKVALRTSKIQNGLAINSVNVNNAYFNLEGSGQWVKDKKASSTNLKGSAEIKDIEQLLKSFGLGSEIVESSGKMNYELQWPKSPMGFSLDSVHGNISVNLKSGRIVEAKTGIGKIISIFSMPSLQRRLRLDFSDLFKKGYSYDYLRGSFKLENGSAQTLDTVMDGPAAYITIAGQTGLKSEDLDFVVVVAPHVGGGLPIAAALGVVNPAAGAVAFLVDRMFTPEISKYASYSYQVNGTWHKPQIELKGSYTPGESVKGG